MVRAYKYLQLESPSQFRLLGANPAQVNAIATSVEITPTTDGRVLTSNKAIVNAVASPIVVTAMIPDAQQIATVPAEVNAFAQSILIQATVPGARVLASSSANVNAVATSVSIVAMIPTVQQIDATPAQVQAIATSVPVTGTTGNIAVCLDDSGTQYLTRSGANFDLLTNSAITGWFKLESTAGGGRVIAAKGEFISGVNAIDWTLDVEPGLNTFSFNVTDDGGSIVSAKHTSFTIQADVWYYIHAFKNSSQVLLYVGLESLAPTLGGVIGTFPNTPQKTANAPFTMGALLSNGVAFPLFGRLDLWQFWNGAPPDPVVLWNSGFGSAYVDLPDTTNLTAAWDFDSTGQPATWPDSHVNGLDLTAVGTPLPSSCEGKGGGGPTDEFEVASVSAKVDAVANSIIITGTQPLAQVIGSESAEVNAIAQSIVVTSSQPNAVVLASLGCDVEAIANSVKITSTQPNAALLGSNTAIVECRMKIVSVIATIPADGLLPALPAEVEAVATSVVVTATTGGAVTLGSQSANVQAIATSVQISATAPGARTLSAVSANVDAVANSIVVTATQAAEQVLASTKADVNAFALSVPVTATVPPARTLTSNKANVEAQAFGLVVTATIPPPNEGPAATFDGGYLWRNVNGYLPTTNEGFYSVWIKGNQLTPINLDEPGWLFSGTGPGGRRLQVGVITPTVQGEVQLYFEMDDGTAQGAITATTTVDLGLNDSNFHNLVFGFDDARINEDGGGWVLYVDGVDKTADLLLSNTQVPQTGWFGQTQSNSSSPGLFDFIAIGANLENGPGAAIDFYNGVADEPMMFIGKPNQTDVTYLYNSGNGVLLSQLEADNPALWNKLHQGWELSNEGTKNFGDEFKGPVPGFFNVENVTASTEGIPGLAPTKTAATFVRSNEDALWVTNNPQLSHSGAVTVVAWVQFDLVSPGDWDGIVAKQNATQLEFVMFRETDRTARFRVQGGAAQFTAQSSTLMTSTSRWYFIVGRSNALEGCQVIVGDSLGTALDFSNQLIVGDMVTTPAPLNIGRWRDNILHLDGAIDDLALSFERLTDADIIWLYNNGVGRSIATVQAQNPSLYAKLRSHWKMNEAQGQPRADDKSTNTAQIASGNPGNRPGHVQD